MAKLPKSGGSAAVTTCGQECACGHDPGRCCPVTNYINPGVQFVEDMAGLECPSRVAFGTKLVCTCKERSKLFLREGR